MITIPSPYIDAPLIIAFFLVLLGLLASALAVHPKMNDGRILSRMRSYSVGLGIVLGGILLLATYRGIEAGTWGINVPQLWIDSAVLVAAAVAATVSHRLIWGEPEEGDAIRDLAEIGRKAEEDARNALSN